MVNRAASFKAYKGDAPSIFVSYAHKDWEEIYPIIEDLHEEGYHIWFDGGIDPGNEWPEEIAQALVKCSLFLVFLSTHSIASKNVINEIYFAIDEDKPFLAVHMDQTKLPIGLKLRIGASQAIMKYLMDQDSFRKVISSALESRNLKIKSVGDSNDREISGRPDESDKTGEALIRLQFEEIKKQKEEIKKQKEEISEQIIVNRVIMEAKIQESQKDYYEAVSILEEALLSRENREYYEQLAYYYELCKDMDGSIRALERAVSSRKYDYKMLYKLADMYLGRREYAKAIAYFKLAVHEPDKDYRVYYSLGKAYESVGDIQHASENYLGSLHLHPALLPAYLRLASCLARSGDEKEAILILKKGNSMIPNNYKIIDLLVDLLAKDSTSIPEAELLVETYDGSAARKSALKKYLQR
ncbi:MAG: hypothetical protein K0R57_3157 [Paenibacillaceae bacterium]|jgi:tetratricopeptide (TPR) repeat protein|nr:hypothetical protein [Paenibacillaceae bacterium]